MESCSWLCAREPIEADRDADRPTLEEDDTEPVLGEHLMDGDDWLAADSET
jgi:hypothetical protein